MKMTVASFTIRTRETTRNSTSSYLFLENYINKDITMKIILTCFELMSVIKINYTKREIIYIKMLACSMFVFKLV
jgi:hypothetical protein